MTGRQGAIYEIEISALLINVTDKLVHVKSGLVKSSILNDAAMQRLPASNPVLITMPIPAFSFQLTFNVGIKTHGRSERKISTMPSQTVPSNKYKVKDVSVYVFRKAAECVKVSYRI